MGSVSSQDSTRWVVLLIANNSEETELAVAGANILKETLTNFFPEVCVLASGILAGLLVPLLLLLLVVVVVVVVVGGHHRCCRRRRRRHRRRRDTLNRNCQPGVHPLFNRNYENILEGVHDAVKNLRNKDVFAVYYAGHGSVPVGDCEMNTVVQSNEGRTLILYLELLRAMNSKGLELCNLISLPFGFA